MGSLLRRIFASILLNQGKRREPSPDLGRDGIQMVNHGRTGRFAHTALAAWGVILSAAVSLALFASRRQYFTFGTETDFVSGFANQARAILAGQPLQLGFHPPLYPVALALVNVSVEDWLTTGLVLSWVASLVSLIAQYRFFALILKREAGVGAVVALVTSTVFTTYAMMATSDLFFLALWSASLWLAAAALENDGFARWAGCGLLVGLALLARTNGVTLLVLLVLPWLSQASRSTPRRWTRVAAWMLGLILPLMTWVAVALHSGSEVLPRSNYSNLAMTYFGSGDRISGESRIGVEQRFDGLLDVITHDPVRMGRQYVHDLLSVPRRLLRSGGVTLWVAILAVAGLPLRCARSRRVLVFASITALQVAIVNLKTFEARYWLFLVPWLGALAGAGVCGLLVRLRPRWVRAIATTMLLLAVLVSGVAASRSAREVVHQDDTELGWLVATVRSSVPVDAIVVARKWHLAQYAAVAIRGFPNVASVEDLRGALLAEQQAPIFLYYGSVERWYRPALRELADPETAPEWLEPLAVSPGPESWVLYRVKLASERRLPSPAPGFGGPANLRAGLRQRIGMRKRKHLPAHLTTDLEQDVRREADL
jgi:hypothetical protein